LAGGRGFEQNGHCGVEPRASRVNEKRRRAFSQRRGPSIVDEYAALAIAETRKKGAFMLPGIGKSVLVKRKARIGRNPATGETIKIPAKTVVKIRPAKAFKDAIVPSKK
jgi:DNA-binding protein HU-beta